MKNIAKKIAVCALAFTLLGTGTAVTKTITPDFDTAITASAACNHNMPRPKYGEWKKIGNGYGWWYKARREIKWYCNSCGKYLYSTYETKTMKYGDDLIAV